MKILLCFLFIISIIFPDVTISKVNGRNRNRAAMSKRLVREGNKDLKGGELNSEKVGSVFKKIKKDTAKPPVNPLQPPVDNGGGGDSGGGNDGGSGGGEDNGGGGDNGGGSGGENGGSSGGGGDNGGDSGGENGGGSGGGGDNEGGSGDKPTIPLIPLTPAESIELEKLDKELSVVIKSAGKKIENVKSACVGISEKLEKIDTMSIATAGVAAGTTAVAGGALIAGAVKSNKKNVADALVEEGVDNEKVKKNQEGAKSANNWRTGLSVVSAMTSAAATGTAGASISETNNLPDIIKKCNDAINAVKVENSKLKVAIEDAKDKIIAIAKDKNFSNTKGVIKNLDILENKLKMGEKVKENCEQYDTNSVNFVKGLSISSTALSGVGTATGLIGAFTSGFAKQGAKNEKALDITSNVMNGLTAGTSVATIGTASDTVKRVKDLKEKSDKCENYLNSLN